jgi:hypothetical protein
MGLRGPKRNPNSRRGRAEAAKRLKLAAGQVFSSSNCLRCGKALKEKPTGKRGRRRKYCPECPQYNLTPSSGASCIECGKPVKAKPERGPQSKYCSAECRYAWRLKHAPSLHVAIKCARCGVEFLSSTKDTKHCVPCSRIARRTRLDGGRLAASRACVRCGIEFHPSNKRQRFCTHACANPRIPETKCPQCGNVFLSRARGHRRRYCSRECAFAALRALDKRGKYRSSAEFIPAMTHVRRAAKYGVVSLPYDKREIFEKGGWICGVCGQAVDKYLIWPDPMSASVDHIKALSKGGTDTADNIQCAHLSCNSAKWNKEGFTKRGARISQ